jgi:asparagine synthase (glutamine-hydrolysing)
MTSDTEFRGIDDLEFAAGWVFGRSPLALPPAAEVTQEPLRALEDAIRRARGAGPCFVSFSGGRDSSVVLAVATHTARLDGLPDPVAVTDLFPGDADSEEGEWQELALRHLGIDDWVRRDASVDGGLLGPASLDGLRRHGVIYPPTAYSHASTYRVGAGGVMLTGEGGDEVFGAKRITLLHHVLQRKALQRRMAAALWHSFAPTPMRRRRKRAEIEAELPWVRAPFRREIAGRMAADETSQPLHWYRAMLFDVSSRSAFVGMHNLAIVAREQGTELAHPLRDEAFLAALEPVTGALGRSGRGALMESLFGELLPAVAMRRSSKAVFNNAYFNEDTRQFTQQWSGRGLPDELVDAEWLRGHWLDERAPAAGTAMLLHTAWLADQAAG